MSFLTSRVARSRGWRPHWPASRRCLLQRIVAGFRAALQDWPAPPDAVKINANENPLGPCPAAVEAAAKVIKNGGRYSYELTDELEQILAEAEDLDVNYVQAFAGSSDPLHRAMMAFTTPTKPLISANPDYEAAGRGASFRGMGNPRSFDPNLGARRQGDGQSR